MIAELPEALVAWIEAETGGRVIAARRAGEGASRQAWAIDLERPGGSDGRGGREALFCLRDAAGGSGGSMKDAAVLRALTKTALPVPGVRAASAERAALLLDRIPGRGDFPAVDREEEREPTARDLMRLTAMLHALEPASLDIPHLGRPDADLDPARAQLAQLASLLATLGDDALPLQRFAARWLERHPPRAARTSLVHSDMGPGNFLSQAGRITALLDWEIAHWGDPMEDLAAIAVRDMATPIGPLERRYAEYATEGGSAIDLAAIAWYRVFILARNTSLIALGLRRPLEPASRAPLERFQLLLLRALALCLCDVAGVPRPTVDEAIAARATIAADEAIAADAVGEDDAARARRFALGLLAQATASEELLGDLAARFPQPLFVEARLPMILGIDPRLVVSPDDDDHHRPTSADPRWLETVWFPFWIPEEGISVYARLWFRPNAGEQGGAVHAWRGTSEVLAYDGWTERFGGFGDLRDLKLARGFRLACLEPLTRYRLRHTSRDLDLDVVFTARMAPNPVPPEESPGMFAGHVEQPGRVVGRVRLGTRCFDVDCGSVRDRSWGPREMRSDLRLGNAHGTSRTNEAFFAYVNPDARGVERITSGYLLRDGRAAKIVEGLRFTEWDGNHPRRLRLEARDALGRALSVDGHCVNRQAVDAGHDVYAVLNQVHWQIEGSTSRDVLGENHDIWSRSAWLAAGRAPLPKR